MRKIAVATLILFCLTVTCATEVNIKSITIDGQPAYMLHVGGFAHQNNALQLKFKLSSTIKQPIAIEQTTNQNNYAVQIGPIHDYALALELQKKLNDETRYKPVPPLGNNFAAATKPSVVATPVTVVSDSNDDDKESNTPAKKLWNLRNADIRAVIAEVSRVTGKNFIIDPRVQGKISIVSSTAISDKELYQVFLSMLQISGYAAIPSGDVIKIIPNIDAKTQSPYGLSQLRNPPQGDEMMVAVVPVHYVPSEQLVPVLRPLMPQWSSVSAYAPSNMLILSGRASNIKQMVRIIRQVDSSSSNGIDMIPLRHALAMDVANTLKDLVKTQPGLGSHVQTMIAADDRSNAILLSGSKTERIRLRLLIAKLDRQSAYGTDSNTQVVYLNYLRAEDLVPILAGIAQANFSGNVGTTIGTITRPELDSTNPASNLVSNSSSGNQSPAQTTPPAITNPAATPNTTGAATQTEGTTKPTVQIIAEPNTNSIILNAPVSLIRTLKSVIRQLDIKPAQLLIEALVAEIDENDLNSLGIEWGSDQQTGKPSDFRPGFAIINSQTRIDDFQAQIYALARDRKANILSTPSVVVLDNRQAKILVGRQLSVASTSYPNNAGGTTTASPFTTFDRVNVALHLYVRPQITRGNGIQLQIDQGNDTIDPSSTLNTDNPIFKISSIVTSVHVESGDIVVLGGLTQDSVGNDDNRIPIIGDLPGVGRLFQHNIQSREKRVLMVFIKPCILRSRSDALYVTNGKYTDVRQEQLEFLREQPYNPENDDVLLPSMNQSALPRPFSQSTQQTVILRKQPQQRIIMTK
ncbi:GspD family T2SS secretin variant LspD [Legionella hackeliae]|uniref:Type II protein secretion LspD n=1 Tax=Legionella hackeliae TaxID=449 RepID=A0A0A8UPZ1_LEGHA|nr:GspD family T2SS secretin variant LspD [Legionella hackeliae]KTD09733.1 type II protein secretion LspD [Legionella hackeliae]CEK10940.1 Type II protein secretion LspD [Legionella hackeliae]STX47680.1 type II protein secretion LspD [Legionella hackeliae]